MTLDPLTLAQAATTTAAGRPVLEVAAELVQAAHQIASLLERFDDCVRFVATVDAVDLEASSTRLIVHVRTRPDADPEALRTDRTDTAWGQIVADRARRLVGHRVVIHKQLEQAGDDRKVRVLVWLDDTAPRDEPAPPVAHDGMHPRGTVARDAAAPSSTVARPSTVARDTPAGPAVTVARDTAASPGTDGHPSPVARASTPADEVYARTTAAGIPRPHVNALLRLRYEVATADQLDDQAVRGLLAKLGDPNGLERFRAAAAADHRTVTAPSRDQVPF